MLSDVLDSGSFNGYEEIKRDCDRSALSKKRFKLVMNGKFSYIHCHYQNTSFFSCFFCTTYVVTIKEKIIHHKSEDGFNIYFSLVIHFSISRSNDTLVVFQIIPSDSTRSLIIRTVFELCYNYLA